jgi:hypothetical protein
MTKRWLLVFAMALLLATASKHASGQDESAVGWNAFEEDDPTEDIAAVMIAAPVLGTILGALRVRKTNTSRPIIVSLGLR